jgi:hypothetical protein
LNDQQQQPSISATASCNSSLVSERSATIERSATTALDQCNSLLQQQPLATSGALQVTSTIVEVRQPRRVHGHRRMPLSDERTWSEEQDQEFMLGNGKDGAALSVVALQATSAIVEVSIVSR